MEAIEAIHSQLNASVQQLITEVSTQQRLIEAREAELARQAEGLALDARIRQAERLGQQLMREKVLSLIDAQLEQLGRAGLNAVSLRALRQEVAR